MEPGRPVMDERTHIALIGLVLAALFAVALYPAPIWETHPAINAAITEDSAADAGPDSDGAAREPVHKHAYFFVLVNGERWNFTDPYIEREPWGHFHQDDGIYHKELSGVTVDEALTSLNMSIADDCLRFGPDNATYCADNDTVLRIAINGEERSVAEALAHNIRQGDNIVLYYGDADAEILDRYSEKELPEKYAPSFNEF